MGRVIAGRYRLGDVLGRGGMGVVYEAQHLVTSGTVAVKLLHPHVAADDTAVERFMREARARADIGHPGLVRVLDAGVDDDGTPFVVMDRLVGEDLATRFARLGSDADSKLDLIVQLLEPLAAAHATGFVHRDLKPHNVFVARRPDGSEVVTLLDFGVAQTPDERRTRVGAMLGTPEYMSPEQTRDARTVTAATDVWAVGVILYEALAGRHPFDGAAASDIMLAACTRPHASLTAQGIGPSLATIVDACLDKDPARRPTAEALARALRSRRTGDASMVDVPPARFAPVRTRREEVQRFWPHVLLTLLGMGTVAVIGFGTDALIVVVPVAVVVVALVVVGGTIRFAASVGASIPARRRSAHVALALWLLTPVVLVAVTTAGQEGAGLYLTWCGCPFVIFFWAPAFEAWHSVRERLNREQEHA